MVINDQFRKQQQTIIWFEDLNPIKLQFDSISLLLVVPILDREIH